MSILSWGIIAIALFVATWLLLTVNRLVTLQRRCLKAFSSIDALLGQRHGLATSLAQAMNKWPQIEAGMIDAVFNARDRASKMVSPRDRATAEACLTAALGNILAAAEACPDIKADPDFLRIQKDLSVVEGKINSTRRYLNSSVSEFNDLIKSPPVVFFAPRFGMNEMDCWEAGQPSSCTA